jgi:hypothetical protein
VRDSAFSLQDGGRSSSELSMKAGVNATWFAAHSPISQRTNKSPTHPLKMKFSFLLCGLLAIAVSVGAEETSVQSSETVQRMLKGRDGAGRVRPNTTPAPSKMVCSSDPGGTCRGSCNCASGPLICGGTAQGTCGPLCRCA